MGGAAPASDAVTSVPVLEFGDFLRPLEHVVDASGHRLDVDVIAPVVVIEKAANRLDAGELTGTLAGEGSKPPPLVAVGLTVVADISMFGFRLGLPLTRRVSAGFFLPNGSGRDHSEFPASSR
jgi:hypothetical protein